MGFIAGTVLMQDLVHISTRATNCLREINLFVKLHDMIAQLLPKLINWAVTSSLYTSYWQSDLILNCNSRNLTLGLG